MNEAVLHHDLPRLRRAIRRVIDAARAESEALDRAVTDCGDGTMKALHQTHLAELDAIQAMSTSLELFDRRLVDRGTGSS